MPNAGLKGEMAAKGAGPQFGDGSDNGYLPDPRNFTG